MAEPLRLLIVENSENDAAQIEAALRRGGFVVESSRVADARGVHQALDNGPWDLVITDYVLPTLTGLEVLSILDAKQIRAPTIVVSSEIGEQATVDAMRAGARDFIGKSNLARLPPAVRRELQEARSRRAEHAAEAKYAVAFRCSPNAMVLTLAEDGRFVEVNGAFEELTGYTRDEVLGRTTVELGFWPDAETRAEYTRRLRAERSVRDLEVALRHKVGEVVDVMISSEQVDLPEGPAILTVAKDITKKNRTQRKREHSEGRFSKAFFANPNPGLITTLADGTIVDANEALCEMAGRGRKGLLGRKGVDLGLWPLEPTKRIGRLLERDGLVRDLELRIHGRDGTPYDLLLSAVAVELGGEPCVLNVAVDVTERNKLQTQLFRSQRLESIGTLSGGLAHDLNNVLTPILLAIKLLRKNPAHQRERVLTILESNARRGADLIRQLLTFARGAEGHRVPIGLGSLVDDVATMVHDTFPKSIELEVRVDPDLWPVEGDPTQFHQILLNLAVNARDAMNGAGNLRLAARNRVLDGRDSIRATPPPGRYVELEVADTGTGIPPEIRREIFDPFFTTKEPGRGTGLGLYTVESIVATHGGFIEVVDGCPTEHGDGSGNRGARFLILLPVAGTRERGPERHALLGAPEGNGELVLIVDDEEAVREIAASVLEASGYRTVPAANGRAALARFEERRAEIRAVVVDMAMPQMDDTETISALKQLAPDLPIIAMSGVDISLDDLETPPGADLFLSKPLTADELLGALRDVLAQPEGVAGHSVRNSP